MCFLHTHSCLFDIEYNTFFFNLRFKLKILEVFNDLEMIPAFQQTSCYSLSIDSTMDSFKFVTSALLEGSRQQANIRLVALQEV